MNQARLSKKFSDGLSEEDWAEDGAAYAQDIVDEAAGNTKKLQW